MDWTGPWSTCSTGLAQRGLTALADELLLAGSTNPQRRLLIVVDQFEELLTQAPPAARAQFAELLRPALTGPVRVLATLRPEFFDQLLVDPGLVALPTRPYPLCPLRREALRAVIERPAQLAGIEVDDGLVDRLVDDTDTGDALPLLAFTLAQLAEGVTRGGRLSGARYDQLGGVRGALTRQADTALAEAIDAGGRSSEEVIAGLLRLVTVDEQGRPTRWRVHRDGLPGQVVTELNAFVTRRLLITDADDGTAVLGVAHEAFLSSWPPLAQAIDASASALRARRPLEHAAVEWDGHGRPFDRLWGGGQLAATVTDTGASIRAASTPSAGRRGRWTHVLRRRHRVLVTVHVDISPVARAFLHASIRRDRFRRRRASTVLSVLLILALVGAGVAIINQRNAQEQQRTATARQLLTQASSTVATDPRTALRLGTAAARLYPGSETRGSLLTLLSNTRYRGVLTGQTGPVRSVAFSPKRRILAAPSDNTVILWDLTDPAAPRRLGRHLTGIEHPDTFYAVAFAPDGSMLAAGSRGGAVILWDLSDLNRPRRIGQPLTDHYDVVLSVAFAPDGTVPATGSRDGRVILWDLTDRNQPHPLARPLEEDATFLNSVAFAPDGTTLATGSRDGTVILWDLTDRNQPTPIGQPLADHTGWVTAVAFSSDGRTLATGSSDQIVILWDLTDPAQPHQLGQPLTSHTDTLNAVAFAPDGRGLATASNDGTVILWDLTERNHPRRLGQPLTGHTTSVLSVAFSPAGTMLATANNDGTWTLWNLADRTHARPLGQPHIVSTSAVESVAFAPDGHTLATGGDDQAVTLWDLTDRTHPQRGQILRGYTGAILSVIFSPDGHTLATGSGDRAIVLWDTTHPDRPHRLGPPLTGHTEAVRTVVFAPDGRSLATGGDDGTVILWDLTDRTRPHRFGHPLNVQTNAIQSVAFAPDGTTLAASSYHVVNLWDLSGFYDLVKDPLERACSVAGGGLTRNEWANLIQDLPYQETCPA